MASSRTPFGERSAAANAAILSPSGAPRRKRTLASPGKNMFSNAKNPDLMLGASSEKNASAVLDEWSALSVEERMHESSDQTFLSPGPMTRNRRASKTPARKISPTQVAKPSSPLQPPSPGGISVPVFSPAKGRGAYKVAKVPMTASAPSAAPNESDWKKMKLSPFVWAALVAIIAVVLAIFCRYTARKPDRMLKGPISAKGGGSGAKYEVLNDLDAKIRELEAEQGVDSESKQRGGLFDW